MTTRQKPAGAGDRRCRWNYTSVFSLLISTMSSSSQVIDDNRGYLSVVDVTSFNYGSVISSLLLYGSVICEIYLPHSDQQAPRSKSRLYYKYQSSTHSLVGSRIRAMLSHSIDDGSEHIVDFISKEKKTLLKSVARRKGPMEPSRSSIPAAPTVIYFIVKLVFCFKTKPKKRFGGVPQDLNDTSVLLKMKLRFSREQEEIFRKTSFGFLFDMHTLVFQKELVHLMLLWQLNTERDDEECWYKIGSIAVRFGVEEFSAITGFNLCGQYDLKPLSKKKMLKFKAMMFSNFGIIDKVTRRDVRDVFLDQEFLIDDDDVVKIDVLNGFAFGKNLWERTFFYLTIAIKDGNSIFDELEFQPVYLLMCVDDEKDFEKKFENISRSLSFIKDSQLSGMIEKIDSKNHEKMDTADLFGASDREAYYWGLSDDVNEDNVGYGQYYLSPNVMKVVDNTIKDVLCSKDQPSCEKNNNMEMIVFDGSYQTPENPKHIRKETIPIHTTNENAIQLPSMTCDEDDAVEIRREINC
ncbi:hypothetical protein G4B88_027591 [Cannabis sativa]|uniref:DUF1985 domain-containing protein n=1 Tax=Cannabis sativa TaxID=3483 RepID=A0A7J6HR17_CANSA|nr:hypothetical protein G4B88_027591 [Cannabis sativa]